MTYKEFKEAVDSFRESTGLTHCIAYINPETEYELGVDLAREGKESEWDNYCLYGVRLMRDSSVKDLKLGGINDD